MLCEHLFGLLREQVLLELDAELLAQWAQLLEVLLVLALVLDLGLDSCFCISYFSPLNAEVLCPVDPFQTWGTLIGEERLGLPSKTRTAVG